MANLYRVRCEQAGRAEYYYEPQRLPRRVRAKLRAAGWVVRVVAVDATAEHNQLLAQAAAASRQDASMRGASSCCHGLRLAAASLEALAADVLAAAEGRGSLTAWT